MNEIHQLKQSTNIVDVIAPRISGGLKRDGQELIGLCPFHNERTPSFKVRENKQIFKCFGCGAGGDVFDFLMQFGHTLPEAIEALQGHSITTPEHQKKAAQAIHKKRVEWKQIRPVPDQAPPPNFTHYQLGKPSRSWLYRDLNGDDLGYILRFEEASGKKQIRQLIWATDGARYEWRWQGFDKPRPLYNLHLFDERAKHKILLVEGEKAADAAEVLFRGKILPTCWQGGTDGVAHADYSPLRDRVVYLWPDNDKGQKDKSGNVFPWHEQPGNRAMLQIAELIKGIAAEVHWVRNTADLPDKFDVADAKWTHDEGIAYLKANVVPVADVVSKVPAKTPAKVEPKTPAKQPPPPAQPKPDPPKKSSLPFRPLGFEKQEAGPHRYYFFSDTNNTVVALRPDQMKEVNLTTIAPLNWWEDKFPKKDGLDLRAAVNSLTAMCHQVGVINFNDFRGRGAWLDKGRVVVHAGSHLIVDGRNVPFNQFPSRNIYEQAKPLDIDLSSPLPAARASGLLEVTKMLNWERAANAYLLAGWCVVAPICGALRWRPHIWITGAAGSGKSTVLTDVVRALIENVAMVFQGKTTEAGIRQSLRNDAVPVLFDEADVDGRADVDRIQNILTLMRASSTSDGGMLAKGTAGQTAKTFAAKACFAFASIAVQVSAQADRSRVTILGLKPNINDPDQYERIVRKITEVISPAFARDLQARAISLIPTIIKNAATFAKAAAIEIGQQRAGDQLGAMLSGAYSLEHDGEISLDDAKTYIRSFDWEEEKSLEGTRDEVALLSALMEEVVGVESSAGRIDRSIGELIALAAGHAASEHGVTYITSNERLRRLGIKVEGTRVFISNDSKHLKRMLENTAWAKNWNKILIRLEGAEKKVSTSFCSEIKSRAVSIPLELVSKPKAFSVRPSGQSSVEFDNVEDGEPF